MHSNFKQTRYKTHPVGGVDELYREAGPADAPAILLLHGFPTASHMFRDPIPLLADRYRLLAPDLPGFAQPIMNNLRTLLFLSAIAVGVVTVPSGSVLADVNNIILVHGANVDGGTWRDVYDRLTADDYKVAVVQMPLTSTEEDIAAVQRIVDVQDGPVLLVGHSYGGVVISEVGVDPVVRGLVYIAALQPDAGESGESLFASSPTEFTPDKLTVFKDGHYLIHEDAFLSVVGNGLSHEDAIFVARSQAASNSAILEYRTQSAAWTEKPNWSVIATLDRTIAPDLQRHMSERAGSTVVEIENGHMLPMTNPDEVADVIRQAAEVVE